MDAGAECDVTRVEDDLVAGRAVVRLSHVTRPTLTVFRPPPQRHRRIAVIVVPGGGYHLLAWDLEGLEVARWLESIGITAIVLKYRVPHPPVGGTPAAPREPLADAQRAIQIVRDHAEEWDIDRDRIGMLGFSAGAHLAATMATAEAKGTADPARLNFLALIYPAYLIDPTTGQLRDELRIAADAPRTFLVHASDDRVPSENSIRFHEALTRQGVAAELHVYPHGGHGFGIRPGEAPIHHWPTKFNQWLTRDAFARTTPTHPTTGGPHGSVESPDRHLKQSASDDPRTTSGSRNAHDAVGPLQRDDSPSDTDL